ncbi:MAG TPA: glycosyltransferase family A protein, partial [Candidatus Hydrogenedentes bacterium]|nr:glycosyltransferase family A protein [Candidatus Hydrogenedentota bacterium]
MLSFTVVLCTKDRADDVRKCLDSIALQTRLPNELLVVDSGTDDTRNLVLDFEKNNGNINVQYLRSEPGLTRQRNVGIRAAKTEVLHFFDDDCTLEPEYFARLQEAFESDTALLGAGPKLFLPY